MVDHGQTMVKPLPNHGWQWLKTVINRGKTMVKHGLSMVLVQGMDLFVLGILKEKWFFLIHCARRKLFSYNRTGYSIITGFAISMPFSCRKIIEETASDLLERKKAVRQWCSQCICYTLVACWSTAEATNQL